MPILASQAQELRGDPVNVMKASQMQSAGVHMARDVKTAH